MEHMVIFPNGQKVCALGQGTWKMGQVASRRAEEIRALRRGIELGLSVIDTAEMYNNEELVGEAIHDCRDKVFLVSKVLPDNASYRGQNSLANVACNGCIPNLSTFTYSIGEAVTLMKKPCGQ